MTIVSIQLMHGLRRCWAFSPRAQLSAHARASSTEAETAVASPRILNATVARIFSVVATDENEKGEPRIRSPSHFRVRRPPFLSTTRP
jgi:hypothetical protein